MKMHPTEKVLVFDKDPTTVEGMVPADPLRGGQVRS